MAGQPIYIYTVVCICNNNNNKENVNRDKLQTYYKLCPYTHSCSI